MTIAGSSYGSVAEIEALTRHLMRGQSGFNTTTRPTVTEVEKFIDRASGVLNTALAMRGLTQPITSSVNGTAKLACDDWVVGKSAEYVELTLRGAGSRGQEGTSRFNYITGLAKQAVEFVDANRLGFITLGVSQTRRVSEGLVFSGETLQADRVDPDDTTLEQPKFLRGQFDND